MVRQLGVVLYEGQAEADATVRPAKRGRAAGGRGGSGARLGLPKAIMFARANIGRAESYLTEIKDLPKKCMRKEWLKSVESHIRDLEYRSETLQNRTLQSGDEDVPYKILT